MKNKGRKLHPLTHHHVPPRSQGWNERHGFVLMKTQEAHRAYHTLFSNVGTFQGAVQILYEDWWRRPEKK